MGTTMTNAQKNASTTATNGTDKTPNSANEAQEAGKEDKCLKDLANSAPEKKNKVTLYKFHQERSETIRTRLWTTLTWIVGIQGIILELQQKRLNLEGIIISEPFSSVLLATVGVFLAVYMVLVVEDGVNHIRSNWHKSDIVLGVVPAAKESEPINRINLKNILTRYENFPAFGLMVVLGGLLVFAHVLVVILRLNSRQPYV